jgi:hypothetical protein
VRSHLHSVWVDWSIVIEESPHTIRPPHTVVRDLGSPCVLSDFTDSQNFENLNESEDFIFIKLSELCKNREQLHPHIQAKLPQYAS